MAYLTLAQGKQILGSRIYESAYINITTDVVDDDILQEDLDDVDAEIDAYLKRVYNSTITGTASLARLKGFAERLLKFRAYSRFDEAELPAHVLTAYETTIKQLEDIASGNVPLPDEAQDIQESQFTYEFNTGQGTTGTENQPLFTRGNMRGF